MSFREKIHWVSLFAIISGFGYYFFMLHFGNHHKTDSMAANLTNGSYFFGLLVMVIAYVLSIMTIASIILFFRDRDSVTAAFDERDNVIHTRATKISYYVLLIGAWGVASSIHWGPGLFFSTHLLLFVIIVAECIRIGAQIYLYRRGA